MVVLDFLGQGQRADPPQPPRKSPKSSDEYATHRAMILENGPSHRHQRTFVTRLHDINDRGSALAGNAVQGPIRFSKDKCGGSNRNGAVFSPRNITTPPEVDAAMAARHSERLRVAIAEARSARAKPPARYRQYEALGRPLPKEARSTPQPVSATLNATTSHIVGTVKTKGDTHLPALPRVKVADEETVQQLRAAAFAAFKPNSGEPLSGVRSERKVAVPGNNTRRRSQRSTEQHSSGTQSERTATENSVRRRRKRLQAAEAGAGTNMVEQDHLSKKVPVQTSDPAVAYAASKSAVQSISPRKPNVIDPHPPPDPRFPPRSAMS